MGMLTGKVAVVTGAGRGLGRAYAAAFGAEGAAVVVNDLDPDAANRTVAAITSTGGAAVAQPGGVERTETADALVGRAVAEFGRLDIMCTNAGLLRDKTLRYTTDEDFSTVLDAHLRGTFTCGRAAVVRMHEQGDGGRLILIGSPAGQRASFGQTSYSAAKAGVIGLVRTWAVECARIDVTVNAVIPWALTDMLRGIPRMGRLIDEVEAGGAVPAPMRSRGLGTAADVAPLLVYLASEQAAGITGQVLSAGGDRIALWSHPSEVAAVVREGGWTSESVAEVFPSALAPWLQPFREPDPPRLPQPARDTTTRR